MGLTLRPGLPWAPWYWAEYPLLAPVHLPIPASLGARAQVGKWVTSGCTHAGETQACDKVEETTLDLMVAGRCARREGGVGF